MRFFVRKGVNNLKNKTFVRCNERKRRRKLHVVLRNITGTQISEKQRRMIEQAVQHKPQCRLQVCGSTQSMHHRLCEKGAGGLNVRTLFGSITAPPMAVLLQEHSRSGRRPSNTVFIYIPDDKKEGTPG